MPALLIRSVWAWKAFCSRAGLDGAVLAVPGEDLGAAGEEVNIFAGLEDLVQPGSKALRFQIGFHVVRPRPQQAQDQRQGMSRRLEADHFLVRALEPLPGPVLGEQPRDERPVRRQELLDLLGGDRVGRAQGIERGRVGDPGQGRDRDVGNADAARVLNALAAVRLGKKAGKLLARGIIDLDVHDVLEQLPPARRSSSVIASSRPSAWNAEPSQGASTWTSAHPASGTASS